MASFDAGSIESTMSLHREQFIRDLDDSQARAERFERRGINPRLTIDGLDKYKRDLGTLSNQLTRLGAKRVSPTVKVDTGPALTKVDLLQAKLDRLAKTRSRPDVNLAGWNTVEARLATMSTQLDRLGKTRATARVNVDTRKSEQGVTRLLDGLLALAPAAIPIAGGLTAGIVGLGGALATAGLGAAAFAAAAIPAFKQVSKAQEKLVKDQQAVTKAQQAGTSPGVIHAQQALATAQARYAQSSKVPAASITSTIGLQKAKLSLASAQQRLDAATPKNEAQRALAVQQAQLSLASAQARLGSSAQSSGQKQAAASLAVQRAQQNLALAVKNSPLSKALAKQKTDIASLTPAELAAARGLQGFKDEYKAFVQGLEPKTFPVLAGGLGLATQGLTLIRPAAANAAGALHGLERDASRALNTTFYKNFFQFISDQAGPTITTFGHDIGNIGTGFAGLIRAFAPVEVQMEQGLERLTKKFSAFGQGATSNPAFLNFLSTIEREGPQVVHFLGLIGQTFLDIAKAAGPLGAAELKIITETLQLVDAAAKAHPELLQVVLAVYTLNKAISTLKIATLVGKLDTIAGLGGKGIGGIAGSLGGIGKTAEDAAGKTGILATVTGGLAKKFPGFTTLAKNAGGAVGALGGVFGATGLAAGALGVGVIGAAAGLTYLGIKLATGKSQNEQFYESLQKQYHATGNNVTGYERLSAAVTEQKNRAHTLSLVYGQELQLSAGAAADATGTLTTKLGQTKIQMEQAAFAAQKNQVKLQALSSNAIQLGAMFGISQQQALGLADRLKIDLSKGFDSANPKLQAYKQELQFSHNPAAQLAADVKIIGDRSQTAANQTQAFGDALNLLSGNTLAAAAADTQARTQIAQLTATFKENKNAIHGNSLAALSNKSAVEGAGQAILGAAQAYQNQGHSARDSVAYLKGLETQLERTLIKETGNKDAVVHLLSNLGLLPSQAQKAFGAVGKHADEAKSKLVGLAGHQYRISVSANAKWNATQAKGTAGAPVLQNATGGYIRGPGGPRDDAIVSRLSAGEYVQPAHVVSREGPSKMDALRAGKATIVPRFASGGIVVSERDNLSSLGKTSQAWLTSHIDALARTVAAAMKHAVASGLPGVPAGLADLGAHGASAAQAQNIARSLLSSFGWAANQMSSLIALWNGESGWRWNALNGSSGAYGIPQSLPASKMASAGPDWRTNAATQERWGLGYIKSTYGNPQNAYNSWLSRSPHWYAGGGFPSAGTWGVVGEQGPELVHFRGPATVYSNRQSAGMAANMGVQGFASGGQVSATAKAPTRSQIQTWKTVGHDLVKQVTQQITDTESLYQINLAFQNLFQQVKAFKGPKRTFLDEYLAQAVKAVDKAQLARRLKEERAKVAQELRALQTAGTSIVHAFAAGINARSSSSDIQQAMAGIFDTAAGALKGRQRAKFLQLIELDNKKLQSLAIQRDRIAARIQAANDLAASVKQGAQQFAGLTGIGALNAGQLLTGLKGKLGALTQFNTNIRKLSKLGLSRELITQIIAAGPEAASQIAQELVNASPNQIKQFNTTQQQIDRISTSLGKNAVNIEFGGNIAKDFIAGLKAQEKTLEDQMTRLAKVFAKQIGKTFHLKGYAQGGTPTAGQWAWVGERGPELVRFGGGARVFSNQQSMGMAIDYDRLAAAVAAAIPVRNAPLIGHAEFRDNTDADLTVRRLAFVTQAAGF